jgi:hypothetical protein
MVIEYLSSQIVNISIIEQAMTNREFGMTSQANHLEKLLLLRNDRKKELSKMIIDYTYNFIGVDKLK